MIKAASDNNLKMRPNLILRSDYSESTIKSVALAFNGSVDFNTVVANFKLFIQMPKLSVTSWTFDLLLLFSSTDVYLHGCYDLTHHRFDRIIVSTMAVCFIVGACTALIAHTCDQHRWLVCLLVRILKSKNNIVDHFFGNLVSWLGVLVLAIMNMRMVFSRLRIPLFVLFCLYFSSSGNFTTASNARFGNDTWGCLKSLINLFKVRNIVVGLLLSREA